MIGNLRFYGHGPLQRHHVARWLCRRSQPKRAGSAFVLTHHRREPLEMEGGTIFHFITDGIEAALQRARLAAGGKDVLIAGGASVIRQYLDAGLIDEFWISLVPLLLGDGERLFDNLGGSIRLEQLEAIEAPGVTHLKFAVR